MRIAVTLLLSCSPLLAQAVTSPIGLDTTEGNNAFNHFTGSRRFLSVDNSHSGSPLVIRQLAFRRNGGVTQTSAGPRTFDLTMDLGEANFGELDATYDNNYLPGTRTNVFPQAQVNFPDWNPNLGAPAPFDFTVPLSTPWVYTGVNALVIDFIHQNNSSTGGVSVDRDYAGQISGTAGVALGTGCTVSGAVGTFSHTAFLYNLNGQPTPNWGMRLRVAGTNAAPNSAVLLFVDYQDPNITGVLCADLHALPLILFVLSTNAAGAVTDHYYGFGYDASLVGAQFYTQLATIDPFQPNFPVALSNGRQITMPAGTSGRHNACYGWNTYPNAAVTGGLLFFGGSLVIQLGL